MLKWEKEFYRCLGLGWTVQKATEEANSRVKKRMGLLEKEPLAFVPIATTISSSLPDDLNM
ncbi:hypothetical protein FTUN_1256 [Frigoriglobus tundricola]|uniref:Uncharacterized protein n=1 Tax=Frigoriglobus tundricola TaxID=2774151 RepID=A0A6M5YI81_9BACT|nr:hypothetical protein FTUN_1256 [Frigoriglobus tundricola]